MWIILLFTSIIQNGSSLKFLTNLVQQGGQRKQFGNNKV